MNEMTIRGAGKMANLRVWNQRVAECRGSGLPVSRWCQEHGINAKTYYTWQKKVFEAMVEEQQGGPRFARVSAQQPENSVAATRRGATNHAAEVPLADGRAECRPAESPPAGVRAEHF